MLNTLLIMSNFFGYENLIQQGIKDIGYNEAVFLDYEGGNSFFKKFLVLLPNNLRDSYYTNRLTRKLKKIDFRKIDFLLLIKGARVKPVHLEYIRRINPNIQFVMYQWDSIKRFDYNYLLPYFNRVLTFDFEDAQKYKFEYLPLFYTPEIAVDKEVKEDIDVLLVGTYLPERYRECVKFEKLAQENNLSFTYYLYTPFSCYIREILNKRRVDFFKIKLFPLSRKKLVELYKRSKVFLDIVSVSQTGLSMRTIEAFGMNKKIITSNFNLKEDPIVKDMEFLSINSPVSAIVEFIDKKPHSYHNIEKLSLRNWLKSIYNSK